MFCGVLCLSGFIFVPFLRIVMCGYSTYQRIEMFHCFRFVQDRTEISMKSHVDSFAIKIIAMLAINKQFEGLRSCICS